MAGGRVVRYGQSSDPEYFLREAFKSNSLCLLASLVAYYRCADSVHEALINSPIHIGLFMLHSLALYRLSNRDDDDDDQVLVCCCSKVLLLGLLFWMSFIPLRHFPFEQSPGYAHFVTLGLMAEGFWIGQAIKHPRTWCHYNFFACVMVLAICSSYQLYGAYDQATWIVSGLCFAMVFFDHLFSVAHQRGYRFGPHCYDSEEEDNIL